jgi:hypothetical protein
MSWWRRRPTERWTREQIDEAVRLLYATARAEPGEIVKLPAWMDPSDLNAFHDILPYVREDVQRQRYQLQADGILLPSI